MNSLQGPAWDNTTEYPGLDSAEFRADQREVEDLITKIHASHLKIAKDLEEILRTGIEKHDVIKPLQAISALHTRAGELYATLVSFTSTEASVDGSRADCQQKISELQALGAKFDEALIPISLFLTGAPQAVVDKYLSSPATKPETFQLERKRLLKDTRLSEPEEVMLTMLGVSGHQAWGNLYNDISSTLKCTLETGETVGLSEANSRLRQGDENARRVAWHGIQDAWKSQSEPCAAILNALAGWRLAIVEKRSHTRKIDFLSAPLHTNLIDRETLQALLAAVTESAATVRGGLRRMARAMGKKQLDPWDLLAPAPVEESTHAIPFADGLKMVAEVFSGVDPELGDFIWMMAKNNWLEGRVLPNKRQGAFCTGFAKSRQPRVFLTYNGSLADVKTLTHEVGHAYHSWIMRDIPRIECRYPSTLAETASIFAETVLEEGLRKTAQTRDQILSADWEDTSSFASFLLNIPARYDFEREFYEQRKSRCFSAEEFSEGMAGAFNKWYGDALSQPDRMYWASKMHFYFSRSRFYNFPYTFGFLFSRRIYSLRAELGKNFMPVYKGILRDTGRMTAEDLIKKHLNEDIRDIGFWRAALRPIEKQIREFEALD